VKTFSQSHDESLDGLLISDSRVHLFPSTEDRKSFVLVVKGVLSLKADGFREASSILDVLGCWPTQVTFACVGKGCGVAPGRWRISQLSSID
jgi:hypothetical protein